ncbi:hypothetical protein KMW28_11995 [Flammeovirga yaeyamensis]|uniref:OmpH family outer membrane protein n=1 Tax=Flammeovirga yaeyamensis TaxID=367791 RepID=A0AAX1MYG1_9BACT|nr:hypothetical protein [Flammeovirga yaeyamensis]MBB3696114.1 hypothetical protein [Flammeovirga yaeyamensis]NMF34798.1 hypothetical protein [Flammeovirga yaeyamensis]QWG00374.1 hypothetical protein KMW28_11995 [Flammeovirga yaeyamensis]
MKIIQTFLLFLLLPFFSNAQSLATKDDVLAQMMLNPKDTLLWESYMGKTWVTMTIFEKEQCQELSTRFDQKLQEQLKVIEEEKQNSFTDNFDSEVDSIEMNAEKLLESDVLAEERALQKAAKEAADASVEELKQLSQNLKQNLPLIEDIIKNKTADLGIEYHSYGTENSEEILAWLKNYGQKIYQTTYNNIIVNNGSKK